METSELLERIRETLDQMPSSAGKMTLKEDAAGFEGWVGSWALRGLLRDTARQLEDLQEANEDLAHELYLRREGPSEPEVRVTLDPEARDAVESALADSFGTIVGSLAPRVGDDGNPLEGRVEDLEAMYGELAIRCDNRHAALATRLGEAERDIVTLRSQVGTLLEDYYARREAEREDEEGSPLPERFSIYALSSIPDVDLQSAEAIVDHYGFLRPEELYVLSNRYTLQKMDGVSVSAERAIWQYLDEKDPGLRHG